MYTTISSDRERLCRFYIAPPHKLSINPHERYNNFLLENRVVIILTGPLVRVYSNIIRHVFCLWWPWKSLSNWALLIRIRQVINQLFSFDTSKYIKKNHFSQGWYILGWILSYIWKTDVAALNKLVNTLHANRFLICCDVIGRQEIWNLTFCQ